MERGRQTISAMADNIAASADAYPRCGLSTQNAHAVLSLHFRECGMMHRMASGCTRTFVLIRKIAGRYADRSHALFFDSERAASVFETSLHSVSLVISMFESE